MKAGRYKLVDVATLSASTRYYPTQGDNVGTDVSGRSVVAVQYSLDSNATLTIEGTLCRGTEDNKTAAQQAATFVDITKSAKSLKNNTDGTASYTNGADILFLNGLPLEFLRLKLVTGGTSSNPLIYLWVV